MTLPKQLLMTNDVAIHYDLTEFMCLPLSFFHSSLLLFLLYSFSFSFFFTVSQLLHELGVCTSLANVITLTKGSLKMEFFTLQCRVISQTEVDKCTFTLLLIQLPSQSLHFDLTRSYSNNLDA